MSRFHIPDMSCGHCRAKVEKTVHALDPEARITFDMPAQRITLETRADTVAVQTALAGAGYPATPA